jgi:hypothetical protein
MRNRIYTATSLLTLLFILFVFSSTCEAQVGIGAGGGLYYPGLAESSASKSRFGIGAGYELFARHRLVSFSENVNMHAKYTYQNYFSDIDLPFTQRTRFSFDYLSISVFMKIFELYQFHVTGGAGMALVSVTASKDLLSVTETALVPHILLGLEKALGPDFNLYFDFVMQFGTVRVREDNLPITGFKGIVGFTMFISK